MARLWLAFCGVMVVSFLISGLVGSRIYLEMSPIADTFVTTDGVTLINSGEVMASQNVWQALGRMQVGSVWGHGSYVAPDWTTDWLHCEAVFILNAWAAKEFNSTFEDLGAERKGQMTARLSQLLGG